MKATLGLDFYLFTTLVSSKIKSLANVGLIAPPIAKGHHCDYMSGVKTRSQSSFINTRVIFHLTLSSEQNGVSHNTFHQHQRQNQSEIIDKKKRF